MNNTLDFYPEITPYEHGMLDVDEHNRIYWELSGNPDGIPVVFVHGGPGGATSPAARRFFDPQKYKIILFDQRGCGKSTPSVAYDLSQLHTNTTENLIEDMEKLRKHLNIDSWLVFGGSWGSTLSLLYAQRHTEHVLGLVLRGIFTSRQVELDWFEQGAKMFAPKQWEKYVSAVKLDPINNSLILAYNKVLFGNDEQAAIKAAVAWSEWETSICFLAGTDFSVNLEDENDVKMSLEIARLENHYFLNYSWLYDHQIIDQGYKLKNIPVHIVQGSYDLVCPPITAYEVHKAIENSKLYMTVAGHAGADEANRQQLLRILNEFEV